MQTYPHETVRNSSRSHLWVRAEDGPNRPTLLQAYIGGYTSGAFALADGRDDGEGTALRQAFGFVPSGGLSDPALHPA